MKKLNTVITAGPTREKIDPVRFISNRSSGKMGYALAKAAEKAGHNVTLISGPVNLSPPDGVTVINIESANDMMCEIRKVANSADIIIMAAAVADYRPVAPSASKIKKSDGEMILKLERTTDILSEFRNNPESFDLKKNLILTGFAAETENVLKNAKQKLEKKHLDWIIANDVSRTDAGFQSDDNEVVMISKNGKTAKIPLQSKEKIAEVIIHTISSQR